MIKVCLFCGICVIFTVIDVGGVMYYWGLSIDTITTVANVVAIGLCVGGLFLLQQKLHCEMYLKLIFIIV